MAKHYLSWTFEELGKERDTALEVEFECHVSQGCDGDRLTPPEPAQIEFAAVTIVAYRNNEGEIAITRKETLKEVAFILAEKNRERLEETLLENIKDADEAALEDYYDRKRDEQRGC